MTDGGIGGSGGDSGRRGFASGLAVGAIITFVVTATLAPIIDFFSFPVCYVLDRSDDFMIGNYDKELARFREIRLQEDDANKQVEARDSRLVSIEAEIEDLRERRNTCLSALAAQQRGEQEAKECNEEIDGEYQRKIGDLENGHDYHSSKRFNENEQLSKIQEEGDFLARQMRQQIEERAKLPEVCHQFFSMKTLDDIMKEPIRPGTIGLW